MRKLFAGLAIAALGLVGFAPTASAVLVDVPVLDVTVKVLEPSAPLVDVDLDADVKVLPTLPVLSDPLVHVCVNGQVQSVLASVAANLHLDVLGSDDDCKPVTPPTTTPPTSDDPLVHVCVNGVVQSVLASVAVNLHLDVLGSDNNCPAPTTPVTPPPPGSDDPLVHVCVEGKVQTFLLSVALNLHLDVLGSDNKCPVPAKPVTPVTPTPDTPVVNTPTGPVVDPTPVAAPVEKAPVAASDKKGGPLAFTGGEWGILLIIGGGLAGAGALLWILGKLGRN